ncbi:MAG TPA: hypothetical protein VNX15_02025 [Gemmatimonadales bacterium]|jgi:hypothetical protein|nr:hypothetical protein [Gemmatimonadales bacterium]
MSGPGRIATVAAVGFLLCDAALLLYGAFVFHQVWLGVGGGLCLLLTGVVLVAWRRYRRTLEELAAARREMRAEVEELRELIRRHPS